MPTKPSTHRPRRHNTKVYIPVERKRQSSGKRLYTYKWQQARADYLAKHPLCVECLRLDITKPATDVDHIIPHNGDFKLFWDESNWQSLCHSHHSVKTANEDGGFGNRKGAG